MKQNSKNYKLKFTDNHALIVEKNGKKNIILAKNLKIGMNLYMEDNIWEIMEIKEIILKEKYAQVIEEGTVVSSRFYSYTICDDEVLDFEQNLEKSKEHHNCMFLKNN